MSRKVEIELKEDDYFGSVKFIDGKLDQFIIQVKNWKESLHTTDDILDAIRGVIESEAKREGSTSPLTSEHSASK